MTAKTKRYAVYLTGVVSTRVEVEVDLSALDEDDDPREAAIEQAYMKNRASLCHQCASHMNPPGEWIAGSWRERTDEEPYENVEEV